MAEHFDVEERLQKVVSRIVEIRKEKRLTLENMAEELQISVAAYDKIEKQKTALTVERLFQIQIALDVSISDLLDIRIENVYHQNLHDSSVGHQVVKNLYQENRDITDKLIASKDELIASLQNEIQFLRNHVKLEG